MNAKNIYIKIEDLSFDYTSDNSDKKVRALNHLNLEIERGSFVCIAGQNGCGKSTLAKNLNALFIPTEGKVYIDGKDTSDESKLWDIRKSCGMVFQNPDNQLVSSVVEDDVAFGPENLGVDPKEIRTRVDAALRAVGMYEHRKKGPHLLSGGQKQRIAIAGVLAMNGDCIVFDEPTAMLDPAGRRDILEIMESLHKSGKTIILITHFMEETVNADRIIVMNSGSIVMDGSPAEVFSNADRLKELSIDVPFAVEMASELRKRGINIPEGIITEAELVEALCALK